MENILSSKNLKEWLMNKENLILSSIIFFGVVVRLYFFNLTSSQAHWWDSLAFGSLAKNMILGLWSDNPFLIHEAIIRPPLLPIVWSILIRLNFSEYLSIFFIEIVPSFLSLILIYLIAKQIFNKKVALISLAIFSSLWLHLFYSMRIMSDVPALFFSLASIYFFIKSYDNLNFKFFLLATLFISLATLTRYFYGIIGAIYLLVIVIYHKEKIFFKKNFWLAGIIGSIPIIIFIIFNLINYGGLLPAAEVYTESAIEKPGYAYYVLNFIPYVMGKTLTGFFIIGLLLLIFELYLHFDSLFKDRKSINNLGLLFILLFPLIFFIFFLRAAEDRYLFLVFPSLILLTARGIIFVYDLIKKYSKKVSLILLCVLLIFSMQHQLSFAGKIIEEKKESYYQMKEAFLWIKDNTPKDAIVIGDGIDPYAIYYSERKIINHNLTNIREKIGASNYVVLHGFEHQSPELIRYINENKDLHGLEIVKVTFFDKTETQPAVVIYKIN